MSMVGVAPGTVIDARYKVLSRLGAGGMADVFLAEDQQLGRKVALKLLHNRFAEDPGFVERFRREAQAAAGLQHPNVVGVYDRGSFDETYYIAMEYLPGRSLKQLIRQEAPIDPVRAIDLTLQILKAARFAHRHGVIHRDLKPHNVIVDDADHVKVTDFGIARAGASDMTETGSIMGTAQYLSPEQAQGHAVSPGSDLYSIAVVLYELVTGRVPFDADAAVTIALKHVSEPPNPPTAINPNIPPELEQVILWALNKSPADRPGDAEQFITALEQARAAIVSGRSGEHTASMAALVGVAAGEPGGPGGRAAGAGVVAPVPPPPAYDGGGDGAVVLAEEPLPPEEGPGRHSRWPWIALLVALLLAGGAVAAYLLTRPVKKIVPTVVNESLSVASTNVQNAGFSVNTINVTSDHPAGVVIRQDPQGGVKADQGSTVTLTVSQGPGNTTVPSVGGLTFAQARQKILQVGLKVGRRQNQSSDQYPAGQVIGTDPAAGQSPPVGTAVTIIVSSGKPLVNVPDVTGESEGDAKAALQRANFNITTTTTTTSSVPDGNVVSQSPSGGTQAASGSTVTLVIAKAPATTTVPGVKGDTAAAAASALRNAGFTVSQKSKDVNKQTLDGVVISQSPGAGSTAAKGSAVTIVVGHFKAPTPTTPTTTTTTNSTTSTHTST
jgi:beta-lactam-binding protein with PASTA domain/predicted Ser/Thr protein kinase